jgi:NAD(P)-dependent dehydrogenase (short-subunit alcohol dehydrogenase family)
MPSSPPPGALRDRVAVVTGGASGIGRATAVLLAHEGAAVTVADVDETAGSETAQLIADAGGRAQCIPTDVTLEEDCRGAIAGTVSEFGRLDILFNNAGIIRRTSISNTTADDWDRVMAINVRGVFLMSKHAIPAMPTGGVIINTSSGWGLVGGRDAAAYCASKGAVVQLTRAMALDHGPQGIRVNCVCPGDTDTPLLASEAEQLGAEPSTFRADAARRPLGRIGAPDDIARAVVYLASDASGFVTGTTLVVDGGGLAGSA